MKKYSILTCILKSYNFAPSFPMISKPKSRLLRVKSFFQIDVPSFEVLAQAGAQFADGSELAFAGQVANASGEGHVVRDVYVW